MATDPFHTFASTVESSLSSTKTLSTLYLSLLSSSSSSSSSAPNESNIITAHDRLNDALEALRQDVEDVRQSILVVRRSPERFGVSEEEVRRREGFLRECVRQVEELQRSADRSRQGKAERGKEGHSSLSLEASKEEEDQEEDHTSAFEKEHQQLLFEQQDTTLTTIGRTLSTLKSQASTLGTELSEQLDLVVALDSEVDSTQTRLRRAVGKMDELVRRGEERLGGWCVWILVVALFFLLLIAIII